jgi:hypothetical protein
MVLRMSGAAKLHLARHGPQSRDPLNSKFSQTFWFQRDFWLDRVVDDRYEVSSRSRNTRQFERTFGWVVGRDNKGRDLRKVRVVTRAGGGTVQWLVTAYPIRH